MWLRRAFFVLIRIYQLLISPLLGARCCYTPSCSEYASQAIMHYGFFKGGLLAIKRLCRCHPWSKGGHDPLP